MRRYLFGWITLCALAVSATAVSATEAEDYDQAVHDLVSLPQVQAALDQLETLEQTSIERLIELTEIAAPPFAEQKRAERFASLLRATGLVEVEIDRVGNVLGRWRGDGRAETVAVVAHLDTVFPAGTDVRVRGPDIDESGQRRWRAPGIGDNARGLVLLLNLAHALASAGVATERNILFVASVGEEGVGDLRGVKHLFRADGPRVDELIAIDGGNDGRVLNQAIGSHRYRIVVRGPGGHSWGAFGLANPAHALASGIHRFDELAREFVSEGPRTTYNIGRIGGGTSVNAVPFENWAEVDLRSQDPQRLRVIDQLLHEAFAAAIEAHNAARRRGAPLELEYQMIGKRPSGIVSAETPLIQRALAAARHFDLEPTLGSGSTDANVAIARGIPATTISRGGLSGGAHSLAEWWSDAGVSVGAQKALLLLLLSTGVRSGVLIRSVTL